MEVIERAAAARAQLLKVQRVGEPDGPEDVALGFLITLDVGRVLIGVAPGSEALEVTHLQGAEEGPALLSDSQEEEPWWRLIGNPIVRAASSDDGALHLQFRSDDENPRIVRFAPDGAYVRVNLET